jgi:membrane protein
MNSIPNPRRARRLPSPAEIPLKPFDTVSTLMVGILIGLAACLFEKQLAPSRTGIAPKQSAKAPTEISRGGWKQIVMRTWREFNEDRIPAVAAGATFYGLLALFPALGAFVSLYGLFADVDEARRQVASLRGVLPEGAVAVLGDQMTRLAAAPHAGLGATFLTGLLLSIWSSNAGIKAVIAGLNVAYEEHEQRDFLRLNLISLGFTAGAVGFALITTAGIATAPNILDGLGLSGLESISLLRWPVLLLIVTGMLSLLYRYGPSRARARWAWITPGGAFAAIGWLGMSVGYSLYVGNFGHFDRTYGSLGAVVGFMTWIWLSLIVVLLGAELNSELEQQTSSDTTAGPAQPRGLRGAAVADGRRRPPS